MDSVSGTGNPAPLRVVGSPAEAPADWETIYRDHVTAIYRYVYARTGNTADTGADRQQALPGAAISALRSKGLLTAPVALST